METAGTDQRETDMGEKPTGATDQTDVGDDAGAAGDHGPEPPATRPTPTHSTQTGSQSDIK
jgi:hypothetical protein